MLLRLTATAFLFWSGTLSWPLMHARVQASGEGSFEFATGNCRGG